MDLVLLSRIQFALTIAFHYIFPPISIGLGVILVVMEGLYLKTKNPLYERMTQFWVKVFGLVFVIGVASGIVMEFQFGTNWSYYSRYVGDVFGSALAAEGVFAFFLESGFLAVLLFGWNRVGPKMHFFATLMVSLGAIFSAIWIVVANSWMQTPAGYHIVGEGLRQRAEITDFWALVFNPSSMDRLLHVLLGAWQTGAWLVISVSAFYLLKKRHEDFARASIKIALVMAMITSALQLFSGHSSAILVSKYQPAKLAAMEGVYEKSAPAGMWLMGYVNEKQEKVTGLGLPYLLSLMVHFDPTKPVPGLRNFPESDRPPVQATFQAYHVMVTVGMGLIGLSALGCFLWWRGILFETGWVLKLFVIAVIGPQIANQFGWMTAEIGRQPWIVYGLLRTEQGVSRVVSSGQVLTSILLFSCVYALLFMLFLFLLNQKIAAGPDEPAAGPDQLR